MGNSSGPEFAERLDRLGRRFTEIDEKWNDRLTASEPFGMEQYLNGRFALVGKLRVGAAYFYSVACYARASQKDGRATTACNSRVIRQLGDADCDRQHVVLLPVTEFIQGADHFASSGLEILVRFYPAREEVDDLSLSSGLLFKCLGSGDYKTLLVGLHRERVLGGFGVDGSMQPHPAVIEAAPQVVADVSNHTGNDKGHRLSFCLLYTSDAADE